MKFLLLLEMILNFEGRNIDNLTKYFGIKYYNGIVVSYYKENFMIWNINKGFLI